jgi:hypothetical protein
VTLLHAHGIRVPLHRGWEARVWKPDLPPPAENHPVVRLANFALPNSRNTYGEDVAEELRPGQVVASLVEFSPHLAGRGLYEPHGVPRIAPGDLDARAVQRQGRGRAGVQRFFSLGGRAFSLYVVAQQGPGLAGALRDLDAQLHDLVVEAP